ncbi:hypothetical protein HNQ56_000257 [Anaerotaenia torta]|uniref:DUF3298 and DUF4163 domain-containing protein n=1 Tax=Anaerotaenia torta TaxID=433293 RepID=UPI003D26074B
MDGRVIVRTMILQQDLYYKDTNILRYTIKYPQFVSNCWQTMLEKLNLLYQTKASMYERNNIMKLYQSAMTDYEYSVANNYPVHPYEAYVDFDVTYNREGVISLYFDQYEYTGGAHGNTVRYSDTWSLPRCRRMELGDFFPYREDYREFVIQSILGQIKEEIAGGNNIYFDDYEKLVRENFKVNHFYLTEEGVAIYFQQYEIAPYSSGMPTFVIPYGPDGAVLPECWKK